MIYKNLEMVLTVFSIYRVCRRGTRALRLLGRTTPLNDHISYMRDRIPSRIIHLASISTYISQII